MKTKTLLIVSVVALSMMFAFVALAAEQPITISYITFVNGTHTTVKNFAPNWKEIEKRSGGRLRFVNKGGPETVKIFAQAQAVRTGAADMVLTTPSFMGKLAEGISMLALSQIPAERFRSVGLYDYLNEVFNKAGLQFIQMYPREIGTAFVMISREKVASIADFKGKVLRGGDYIDAVAESFGMTVVDMTYFEEYPALKKGMIDIGRMTPESMAQLKLYEVAKYLIKPAYGTAPMSWFMNLQKWNSIPEDLQLLILETLDELAPVTVARDQEATQQAYDEMAANGVESVELQGEDREVYIRETEKAMYDYFLKENPPIAQKVFDMTRAE